MTTPLKVPNKASSPLSMGEVKTRMPTADEFVMLDRSVLRAILEVFEALKGVRARWALAGDASEIVQGVNTHADSVEILVLGGEVDSREVHDALFTYFSSRTGASAIATELQPREEELDRRAQIGGVSYPILLRSLHSELETPQTKKKVKVDGDLRIKVGEWEWGDPIEFEPAYASIVGKRLPVMPLRLRSDLYFGLGWMDRVTMIHEAEQRSHHAHS